MARDFVENVESSEVCAGSPPSRHTENTKTFEIRVAYGIESVCDARFSWAGDALPSRDDPAMGAGEKKHDLSRGCRKLSRPGRP
jgi:hypothetical protein